jgi:hypothetical protein
VKKNKSKYLLKADAETLVASLKASLGSYAKNGGRTTDWLKKIGVSSRTWYKWTSQEFPQIRKSTSIRITKTANLCREELPEFISESIHPTVLLNKHFKNYLDTYNSTDLITDTEKLSLTVGLFMLNSEQLEMFPRVSINTNPSSAVIYTDVSNIVLRITCKEDLMFELINESTVICNGVFDCENIKILIKWLYKQKKSSKTKKVKTLYEQFKSTILSR